MSVCLLLKLGLKIKGGKGVVIQYEEKHSLFYSSDNNFGHLKFNLIFFRVMKMKSTD